MRRPVAFAMMALLLAFVQGCGEATSPAGGTTNTSTGVGSGTAADPIVLSIGSIVSDTIPAGGSVYFTFTTSVAADHSVSLTQTQTDLAWKAFSNADFVNGDLGLCDTVTGTAGDEICHVPALSSGTAYYVALINRSSSAASTYSLELISGQAPGSVAVSTSTAPGSAANPIALELDGTVSGTIPAGGSVYFTFTTTGSTSDYSVSLTGAQADLAWKAFSNADFINGKLGVCDTVKGNAGDEECYLPMLAANTPYYVAVINRSNQASTYDLYVIDGRYTATLITPEVLYFRGSSDFGNAYQLWQTDGTEAGTKLVKTINAGGSAFDFGIGEFFQFGGKTYFAADGGGTGGMELWVTDGTEAGTQLVKDLDVTTDTNYNATPHAFLQFGSKFVFSAYAPGDMNDTLWISDGTADGTMTLDVPPRFSHPAYMTVLGSNLYFQGWGFTGGVRDQVELWKFDGSSSSQVANLNNQTFAQGPDGDSTPVLMGTPGGKLLFSAQDASLGANKQWLYSYTPFSGTDPQPVPAPSEAPIEVGRDWVQVGDLVYFTAFNANTGSFSELWKFTAGAQVETDLIQSFTVGGIKPFGSVNGLLLFMGHDSDSSYEIWSSDGTAANTIRLTDLPGVPDLRGIVAYKGKAYILLYESSTLQLWSTDGTMAGTAQVFQSATNVGSCLGGFLGSLEEGMIFYASNPVGALAKLWKSDGTSSGTVQLGTVTVDSCPQ